MGTTILVSGYFCGQGQREKLAYFERLDAALSQLGYHLFLVNVGPGIIHTRVQHCSIPYVVTLAKYFPDLLLADRSSQTQAFREAVAAERETNGSSLSVASTRLGFFQVALQRILRDNDPCLCVLWHQFNGFHLLLNELCESEGLPVVYAEYGSLPGTVVFETDGQMAESRVTTESEVFQSLQVGIAETQRAAQYLETVRAEKRSRKPRTSEVDLRPCVEAARTQGRRIVFFAGQNDAQTGMLPRWSERAKRHSPTYADTTDCLRHLVRLAEQNDWQIMFKAHPLDDSDHAGIESEYLDIVPGADIFDCIEQSDVTVTILSQTAYLALIHERPVVLLGRNQLSGKGCVYEGHGREETLTSIESALERGFTDAQRLERNLHFAQLLTYSLFSLDEDLVPNLERDVDVVAAYLVEIADEKTARPCGDDVSTMPIGLQFLYDLLVVLERPLRVLRRGVRTWRS